MGYKDDRKRRGEERLGAGSGSRRSRAEGTRVSALLGGDNPGQGATASTPGSQSSSGLGTVQCGVWEATKLSSRYADGKAEM